MSKVFVRGPRGWITCPWKYLEKVPFPFGELAWDHVSGRLAAQGQGNPTELERALAVDDLLRRAYHGPPGFPGGQAKSHRPGTGGSQPARVPERQPAHGPGHPESQILPRLGTIREHQGRTATSRSPR